MKKIVWDYDINPYSLYEVVTGKREKIFHFDDKRVFLRMLERLSWYDIINLIDIERVKNLLTPEVISKLRIPILQDRYAFVRKILHGEPVSFTGWDPEYRKKIKSTLLSNRWYRFR